MHASYLMNQRTCASQMPVKAGARPVQQQVHQHAHNVQERAQLAQWQRSRESASGVSVRLTCCAGARAKCTSAAAHCRHTPPSSNSPAVQQQRCRGAGGQTAPVSAAADSTAVCASHVPQAPSALRGAAKPHHPARPCTPVHHLPAASPHAGLGCSLYQGAGRHRATSAHARCNIFALHAPRLRGCRHIACAAASSNGSSNSSKGESAAERLARLREAAQASDDSLAQEQAGSARRISALDIHDDGSVASAPRCAHCCAVLHCAWQEVTWWSMLTIVHHNRNAEASVARAQVLCLQECYGM